MSFCKRCGHEMEEDARFCSKCGTKADVGTNEGTGKSATSLGIVAIIIGAMGIFWAWAIAIFGWILGGVGLALALVGKNKNANDKNCKIGLILSAVALGCSFINSMLGILLML